MFRLKSANTLLLEGTVNYISCVSNLFHFDLISFASAVTPTRSHCVKTESRTLNSLCDAPLPRLVSGDLRVNDEKQFVSSVSPDATKVLR